MIQTRQVPRKYRDVPVVHTGLLSGHVRSAQTIIELPKIDDCHKACKEATAVIAKLIDRKPVGLIEYWAPVYAAFGFKREEIVGHPFENILKIKGCYLPLGYCA